MDKSTDTLDIQIAKAKENLSEESRDAINAVSWKLILSGINNAYSSDQLESLEIETELLLCGLLNTEDYPKELESRMHLHKAEVETLINEIDKLIFKKIQEGLEKRLNQKKVVEITNKNKPLINDPDFINTPKDIQTAVSLSNWKEKLYNISKKYNLSVEKMGELEDITIKTLKGEILASKYESEVKNRIVVPEDKEKEMIALINEEIFKVIKNTLVNNSSIKPAENKKEVPVPPYVAKKESTVPLPPSSYKKPDDKIEINKIETIKKNENDLYKEHGIEIIPDIPIAKDVGIFNPIKKETLYREEIPTKIEKSEEYIVPSIISTPASDTVEYREAIPNNPMGNIITNKLSGNTTSKTTMSDYSLPKISKINQDELEKSIGEKSINPHDPYHEAI